MNPNGLIYITCLFTQSQKKLDYHMDVLENNTSLNKGRNFVLSVVDINPTCNFQIEYGFHQSTYLCNNKQWVQRLINRPGYIKYTWTRIPTQQTRNTLRPQQKGSHLAEDISQGIFLNKNVWILIKISLKYIFESWQRVIIGSGNGLVLMRQQAITRT